MSGRRRPPLRVVDDEFRPTTGKRGGPPGGGAGSDAFVAWPKDPLRTMRSMAKSYLTHDNHLIAKFWRSTFYRYTLGKGWRDWPEQEVRAWLWLRLEGAIALTERGEENFAPGPQRVAALFEAAKVVLAESDETDPPAWTDTGDEDRPGPSEFFRTANGLVHGPSREIWPDTPAYFSLNCTTVPYIEDAPEPKAFLRFLDQQWAADPEAKRTFLEWLGAAIVGDVSHQKILLIVGPTRSGKGILQNVVVGLIGEEACCFPKLNSLGERFGRAMFIGRRLAIITDARLSHKADKVAVSELLLSVSGGDRQSVERKHLPDWHGRFAMNLLVFSNELPALLDPSGALAGRFVILQQQHSFLGREDPTLSERLLAELPGIMRLALDAYGDLRARGRFEQPTSGLDAVEALGDLASPIRAFVRDQCRLDPKREVTKEDLYDRYKAWCGGEGYSVSTKPRFARDLLSAFPFIRPVRPRDPDKDGARVQAYSGIGLKGVRTDV